MSRPQTLISLALTGLFAGCTGTGGSHDAPLPSAPIVSNPSDGVTHLQPLTGLIHQADLQSAVSAAEPVGKSAPSAVVVDGPQVFEAVAGRFFRPLVVRIVDPAGATIPTASGIEVTAFLSAEAAPQYEAVTTATQAGVAVFSTLRATHAGPIHIQIHAAHVSGAQPEPLVAYVVAGPAASLELWASSGPAVTAGESFSVIATARDAYGNTATGFRGALGLLSPAPMSSVPMPYTFTAADAGIHAFEAVTLRAAGSWPLQVTEWSADPQLVGDLVVTVMPAAAVKLVLDQVPSATTAGSPLGVTVHALDVYGNSAETQSPAWVTVDDPQGSTPGTVVVGGTVGVVLRTAGAWTIRAKDTHGTLTAASAPIVVQAAAASALVFVAQPASAIEGHVMTPAPRVEVRDVFGNLAATTSPVTLSTSGGGLVGQTALKAIGGVVSFEGIRIPNPADGITLTAAADGVGSTISASFSVFPPLGQSLQAIALNEPLPASMAMAGRGIDARMTISGLSGQVGRPGAVCTDVGGNLYIGQEPDGAWRPVLRVSPGGEVAASATMQSPAGIAMNSDGHLVVGAQGALWSPFVSFDGADDLLWAELPGVEVHDMARDLAAGRMVVADAHGRIYGVDELTQSVAQLFEFGAPVAVAIHPNSGVLWAVNQATGRVFTVDLSVTPPMAEFVAEWPVTAVHNIAWHTVGTRLLLYAAAEWADDAGILRFNPETGALDTWISGLAATPPVDLTCGDTDPEQPLYVSLQGTGVMALRCPARTQNAATHVVLNRPGFQLETWAQLPSGTTPGAIAVHEKSGTLAIVSAGEVLLVTSQGATVPTTSVAGPAGVAIDAQGYVYAGGVNAIKRAHLSDAVSGATWATWATFDGSVSDLAVSDAGAAWAVLEDGRVIRVDLDGGQSLVLGPGPATHVAVTPAGDAWLVRGTQVLHVNGELLSLAAGADLAALRPDLTEINHVTWSPLDQHLYLAVTFEGSANPDGNYADGNYADANHTTSTVATYDPQAHSMTVWATLETPGADGFDPTLDAHAADGLVWDQSQRCLMVSSPATDTIHRICECN